MEYFPIFMMDCRLFRKYDPVFVSEPTFNESACPMTKSIVLIVLMIVPVTGWAQNRGVNNGTLSVERKVWSNTYNSMIQVSMLPTEFLTEVVKDIKPGKALDVACGQGRNSIFLASRGWNVTGFDIDAEALDSAQAKARRMGVEITTTQKSKKTFKYGVEQWDLIALIYADVICGGCIAYDRAFIRQLRESLKPGGIVVYEFFHRDALKNPPWGCDDDDMKDAFLKVGGFEILTYEEKDGYAEWDKRKRQKPSKLVFMVARKL